MINTVKRDIHCKKGSLYVGLENLRNDNSIMEHNKDLIVNFIRDCRLGKTLKKKQKKIIGEMRCLKYLYNLKRLSVWFNKPFDNVNQNDMETLIENLENDKFKSKTIRNDDNIQTGIFSHSTKVDYKKTIRKFYKWLFGNNEYYPELVDWIDTYDVVKEIPALRREEIERLTDESKTRDKAIIMVLFDSGARAEEFLNVKLCDLVKNGDTYKMRIVHSKTKPRTIHLPIASKYLDMWLQNFKDKNDDKYLFPLSYNSLRKMLHVIGKKILNKSVYPHLLRHSSATYYANLLNHQQLCYRYGWSMSSDMPNRYLDREGIFEEETTNLVKAYDMSRIEKQNQKYIEEISIVKQTNEDLSRQLKEFKEEYDNLFQGKNFMKLLSLLANKQEETSKSIERIGRDKFDFVLKS